jgi:ankyrin repeat protein
LNGLEQNYNYGFNILHYQVLSEKKADNIQIKVKTSLTKKPQTNFGMTPMHIVCINPDSNFIKKLVELGGDWNVLDDLNRKPIHYAACCKSEKPLNYLLSLGALIDEVDNEADDSEVLSREDRLRYNVWDDELDEEEGW